MGRTLAARAIGGIDASRELGSLLAQVRVSVLALMRRGELSATLGRWPFAA
jgi:hypothetical protein